MQNFLNRLFYVDFYTNALDRDKARLIYGIVSVVLTGFFMFAVFAPDWYTTDPSDRSTFVPLVQAVNVRPVTAIFLFTPFILGFITVIAVRLRFLVFAGWMTSITTYALGIFPVVVLPTQSYEDTAYVLAILVFILISTLLNSTLGLIVSLFVGMLSYLADVGNATTASIMITLIIFCTTGAIAYFFLRFVRISREEGERTAGLERVRLAEVTTQLTRLGSQRTSMKESLDNALALIQSNYPQFYHVQVFLIEETGVQAQLIASTGKVGEQLLAREHGLAVGSLSVIGQTTFQGKPVQVDADASSATYRPNDLLPNTKTEAAFPIRLGNKVIGALDLQSVQKLVLDDNDQSTYQSLADSLALVIDNIRQFEGAQSRVEENQRLTEQARNALQEVQRLNKRLIGRAWADYLKDHQETIGVAMDFANQSIDESPDWTTTLGEAVRKDTAVVSDNIVAVPLRVRGQVIGALEVELDNEGKLSQDDVDLLQEIGERFGMAAENTRLIEQSQRAAQREALINVVSSRLQTTNNVESTLAEAARSLSEMLQAERVVIRLGKPARTIPNRGFGEA
jgi:GAF domain-containing protein